MSKRFYITTAIDYTNGAPHLGHAYEKVLSDVIARMMRLQGQDVWFLTGTDEHGQKVQQSAQKVGVDPQAYVDEIAEKFEALLPVLNISNTDFVRTTQPRHKKIVQQILQEVYDKGLIYKSATKGFYSVRQEQFLMEKDRQEDGSFGPEWGEVVEMAEENYYFRQSQFQDWLIDYIKANPDFIQPAFRQAQVLEFLKEPLNDMCISRPKSRLSWGIELPFDTEYVTFVWFDALINYISVVGYGTDEFAKNWPANYHVIGKDILVPAHAIYWPIMLHAIGVDMPKTILAHGWWALGGGQKMSKSVGNVVDPVEISKKWGADAFRYFVTAEMNVGHDAEFTFERFNARYNADLANDLGNLVSRLTNMLGRYCDGVVPSAASHEDAESELKALWETNSANFLEQMKALAFPKAVESISEVLRKLNAYIELRAPWKLAKSQEAADRAALETTLATVAEGVRLVSTALMPIIPASCLKIRSAWGLAEDANWSADLTWGASLEGKKMENVGILFPKQELEPVEA